MQKNFHIGKFFERTRQRSLRLQLGSKTWSDSCHHYISKVDSLPENKDIRLQFSYTIKNCIHIFTFVNSLGPIADIPAIISTICFRRHNLCKSVKIILTKFSHILKNTRNH